MYTRRPIKETSSSAYAGLSSLQSLQSWQTQKWNTLRSAHLQHGAEKCPGKASAMREKRALGSCASRLAMSVCDGIPRTGQTHAGGWDCGNVLECFANWMNQEDLLAARFVIGGEETKALVLTVVITKVSSLVTPRAFKLGRATEENATTRK